MGILVGIDLGTTNSCVAVHESCDIPGKEELVGSGRLRRVGRALVVTDEYRSGVTPSVVWVGPDGEVLVGSAAQQTARVPDGRPPASFFKRAMGTDEAIIAGHATLTAPELSTHVLRYLKEMAEATLGVPVTRAVVTVPAHFGLSATNATTDAAAAAGLEVVETLQEPVAAALAYLDEGHDTTTDPGTFLVYDLGGGTFDVSVVGWDADGVFDMRGTDGDRYLGGYDFDKALLEWVADALPGFDLNFDEQDPADARTRARLLDALEGVKIDLSRSTHTTLHEQRLDDRRGTRMSINLPIDRAEFARIIEPTVRTTIGITDRVLAAKRIRPDEIDDIVLAGGSSRIPCIADMLAEHFGHRPRQLDPDLCVGIGAALRTERADVVTPHLEIANPVVNGATALVTGRVRPAGPITTAGGQLLALRGAGGTVARTHSRPDGTFEFEDVAVGEDGQEYELGLVHDGDDVDLHRFTVAADDPGPVEFDPVLARTFAIHAREGLLPVAASGTTVPCEKRMSLYTDGHGTSLEVPILEGHTVLGKIVVEGLPRDLEIGSRVEVTLVFTGDWRVEASARLPSAGLTGHADFHIRTTEISTWEELERRHRDVVDAWNEQRHLISNRDRLEIGPEIDALDREVGELRRSRTDRQKTNGRVEELEALVFGLPEPVLLSPPWPTFENLLDELGRLADRIEARQGERAADPYRQAAASLRANGETAHTHEDQQQWATAVGSVSGQIESARRILDGDRTPGHSAPSPADKRAQLHHAVETEARGIKERDRATQHRQTDEATRLLDEGRRIRVLLEEVDVEANDAMPRLNAIAEHDLQKWTAAAERFPQRPRGVTGKPPGPS